MRYVLANSSHGVTVVHPIDELRHLHSTVEERRVAGHPLGDVFDGGTGSPVDQFQDHRAAANTSEERSSYGRRSVSRTTHPRTFPDRHPKSQPDTGSS